VWPADVEGDRREDEGIADDASRCGIVIAVRTAIRCERVHGTMSPTAS
jgi:hypothetical protein